MKKFLIIILVLVCVLPDQSFTQCAACKATAETSIKEGNNTAKGLNLGIMYLLVMPYILIGGIGYWWYTKNKKAKALEGDDTDL